MATSLALARTLPLRPLSALQNDAFLWQVGESIRPLLASKPLLLVTGSEVEQQLAGDFAGTSATVEPAGYQGYWLEPPGKWVIVCDSVTTVRVPDPSRPDDPVLVRVAESATYE